MPTTPLAHTPLLFLDDPSMRLDRGPYGIRPFVNNHFRLLCGLRPIRDAEDAKPDDEDIHDSSGIPLEYATLSDGFLLTEEAYKGIPASYRRYFTKPCRELHAQYLAQAIKYASQHCEAASSSNGKSKKRGPSARKAAIQDVDNITQSCISSTAAKRISGHAQFKGAILGMYNWSNGVMGRMADLMRRTSRSPVHAWRDLAMDEPESSKGVLNEIITQASMELFGTCALTSSTRVPRPGYKAFVRAILERVWERESRRLNRSLVTAAETRDKCKGALETLTPDVAESPTWENLKEASVSLKKYKDLVELTGGEMDKSIGKLEKSFEDVWVALGYLSAKVRRIKATKKAMLMTKDKMDRAYTNYVELHFPPQKEGVEELTENLANAVSSEEGVNANLLAGSEGSDIGVSEFANTSLDKMFQLLGLSSTMSIPFTSKEYKSQWHQLVAVAVQLKGMFTKQLGEQARATLLCDKVGLGKTAEIIGTLCMLVHLIELQQRGLALIPLLTESGHVYFAGQEKISSLPSIILMPKSLCIQWSLQFQRFTVPGAFCLIDYAKKGSDRTSYFLQGGDYDRLVAKATFPHCVVFLSTFTSIGTEAGNVLFRVSTGAAGREPRFRGQPSTIVTSNAPDCTIFAKEFLYLACDELHQLRNATTCQDGVTKLSCNSLVRTGATASPVFNGAKDAIVAAVILRIPDVIGEAGLALGYKLLESQRSRLKEWKSQQSELTGVAGATWDSDEDKQQVQQEIANRFLKEGDPRGYKSFFVQQPSIERIRRVLVPYIVRRTSKSRMPDGSLILNIPDLIESIVWISINDVERKALVDLYNWLMSEKPKGLQGEMLLSWNSFLMDYKHVLFHPLMRAETNARLEPFWEQWTLENLQSRASSKLLATLSILEHYKDPAAEPLFFNRDGTRDVEQESSFVSPPSIQAPTKPQKILIFIMYDRHTQVTKFMLDLHKYKYVEYNGSMTNIERDRAVKNFESQDDVYIMLLSNVGTTGLNLTMALVIIFLSGLWSGVETKQTGGRCWRPGQLHVVHMYQLLAPNTADEILSSYATSKTIMENRFFSQTKELATKIFQYEDETDSEASENEAPTSYSRSAVVPCALKSQEGDTTSTQPTIKKAGLRKRKAPSSSTQTRDSEQPDASASKPKQAKISDKDKAKNAAQPEPLPSEHRSSSPAQGAQTSFPKGKVNPGATNGSSKSAETASSEPQSPPRSRPRPRPRPRMRISPNVEDGGAIANIVSPMLQAETVKPCVASSSIQVPVASDTPVPTQSAPLTTAAGSADLPLVSFAPESSPEVSSIAAVRVPVLHDPPTQQPSFAPSPDSAQPSTSRDLPAVDSSAPTAAQTACEDHNHSPEPSVGHELSSDYDPDVDVVGLGEDEDLPDISAVTQGGSVADSLRSTGPTLGGPSSLKSSPVLPQGSGSDGRAVLQENPYPHGESSLDAFVHELLNDLDQSPGSPTKSNPPQAKDKATAVNTRAPAPYHPTPARTWRTSTTSRSSAKLTPYRPPQSDSSASIRPRQRDVIPHKAPEPSTSELPDGPNSNQPAPPQRPMVRSGAFKDVSKEDVPKVLAKGKQAVMDEVDRVSQTGGVGVIV
ncbi:hypothetical protein RhiTH_011302 [Rhizoctonia solani]